MPGKKVLIVEDTDDIAMLVNMTLTQLGLTCYHCNSGHKALAFLEVNDPPDLIVLDIGLPGMSGWEFLEIIKKEAYFDHMRILICTAFSDPANRVVGKLQEVDGYITKPFGPQELKEMVTQLIGS